MRFHHLLTGAAAVAIAVSAPAQDAAPTEPEATRSLDLSDLPGTAEQLGEETAPEAPAVAEPAEPTIEPTPAAQTEPPAAEPSPASAAQAPAVPPALASEQQAEMARVAARGRQIFAIARAGMLATQDMLSRVADPAAAGISGWIAEPEGNAMLVTFYGDSESGPAAVYRARVLGGRAVSRETFLTGERPLLTALAERLARARSASESDEQRACTNQPFNVVAIPPAAADGPIDIYRISAPASRSRLPLGGHFRSTVGAGGNVVETRAFSRGCLNVDVGEVPPGSQAGPIAVTHLLDPLPTEIHVFLSLFSGRPLVIAAGDPTRLFMVAGDAIREIRR